MQRCTIARASYLTTILAKASLGMALLGWLLMAVTTAFAATETWTGASGFEWGTSGNWAGGNAVPVTGDTLIFDGTGNSSSPNDDNLGDAFSIATLNFVNNANAYTLTSNSGANNQSLALTTSLIDQASGQTETINFPITGTGTLMMGGTPAAPDPNGNATLLLNANAQFNALNSNIKNATGDTIQLGNNSTLTINGNIQTCVINPVPTTATTSNLTITGTTPGTGTLTANSPTGLFQVGLISGAPAGGAVPTTTLDLSGLSTFSFTGQEADIGGNESTSTSSPTGNRLIATLNLAAVSNTIKVTSTANGVTVGGGSPSNGGTAVLNLSGTGTNTIWTPTLFIGTVKSTGTVQFGSGSGGTFTLRNAAGTGRAAIIVGLHNGAGTTSAKGTLNLNGHAVDILASTLTVGEDTAASTSGTVASSASFDTGTFDVTSIILGQRTGSALGNTTGTFTMGGGNLVVNSAGGGSFVLGSNASAGTGSTTGIFNLSGGTATINCNITQGPVGNGTNGQVNLTGGTLSMGNGVAATNFAIGTSAIPISTFNMPTSGQTATIQNLGGGGIFANGGSGNTTGLGGLTMGDSGTLILAGNNTYTGVTNVNNGTVQFASATPAVNSSINLNGGSLVFNPSIGTFQIGGLAGGNSLNLADTSSNAVTLKLGTAGGSYSGSLSGNGGLTMAGTNGAPGTQTIQTLTGTNSYKGNTTITSGTLQLSGGQLYSGVVSPGTVTINGGTLSGNGTISTSVAMTSGTLTADTSGSALNLSSLAMNGGTLQFSLNGGTASMINVSGIANLTTGSLSFSPVLPVTAGVYTFLTAGTLNHSISLATQNISGTTFIPSISLDGHSLLIQVINPNTLTWVGNLSSGRWDVGTTKNWNNGGTASVFSQLDTVTFDNTASNFNVNIAAAVMPSATSATVVTFANDSLHPYVVTGAFGIGGPGGLTVNSSGADSNGTVTLETANTYSGNTTVQAGTLILSSGGSISSPNVTVTGGGLTINSAGSAAATAVNINNGGAVTVNNGGALTGAGVTVNVNNNGGTGFSVSSGGTIPATLHLVNNGTTTFGSSQTIAALNGTTSSATLTQTGTLTVNGGGAYAGAINGASGALTVAGGTLLLTGGNNYGGATTINSGATLQVDDGTSSTGSLSSTTAITDNGTIIFARSDSPTIGNTISGTGLLEVNASFGTTTLSGNNSSFAGTTGVYSGTLVQGTANALGSSAVALSVGQPAGATGNTTPGNLNLAFNTQVGSFSAFSANTSTAPTSTVTIPTGTTLTVNGAFLIGPANSTGFTFDNTTNLIGGGSLVVAGAGNFMVGQPSNNASGAKDTTNSDMTGLASINVNTTGIFAVGYGSNSRGLLSLADTSPDGGTTAPSNTINASEIDVGNSLSDNNVGQSVLNLGQGQNVLEANTINIGLGKTGGQIQFNPNDVNPTGSITITGTGGGSALANIIISAQNSVTSGSVASGLLLAGHVANVQASSVLIGGNIGNTGGSANGTVTFDTGTFNSGPVTIGVYTSGSSATGPTGTLTIGGSSANTSATGIFNVHGPLILGDITVTTTATATATLTINSGTLNVGGRISVPSTFGVTNSTLTLAGNGVLNMEGNSIGGVGAGTSGDNAITNVQLAPNGGDTPTLMNLGGAGINGAGLTMNGGGTLILDGLNTYTGGTIITSNTLQVGQASSAVLTSPLGDASGTVTVNGGATLAFGSNGTATVGNAITGSGAINQIGNGKTLITGIGSFTGQTNVTGGTLSIQGALNNTGSPGTISITGGNLAGSGTTGADVSLNSGSITPDATGTALSVNSLTTNSGTLQFNVNGANIGKISSSNFANLSGGQLSFGLISAPTLSSYTILTSTSLSNSLSLSPFTAGRTTFTPSVSGNNLVVNVSGGPGTLTWNNSVGGGNGSDWDVQGQQNWTGTATTGNVHQYYQFDNVTFNDSNNGHNIVNISAPVTPLSVTFNNTSAQNYVINSSSGSGIGGAGGLTVNSSNGTGTVTLNTVNTYSGNTTVTAGTLIIGGAGSIAGNTLSVASGAATTVNAGGSITSFASNVNGTMTVGGSVGGATMTLGNPTANVTVASNGRLSTQTVTVNAGSLSVNPSGTLASAVVSVANGGALTVQSGGSVTGTPSLTDNGSVTFNSSETIGSLNGTASTAVLKETGTLTINGDGSYAGAIQDDGPGSLVFAGGTLTLSGTTTYSGNTTIESGTLILNTPSLASQNVSVTNGIATLTASAGTTLASTVNLNNSGTVNLNAAAQTVATLNGNGKLTLNGTALTVTGGGTYSGLISNGISGTGSLNVTGGTLILTATNNFSGGVNVTGSGTTLQVNGGGGGLSALGVGNATVGSGAILVGANGDAFGFTAGAGTSPLNININGGTVTNLGTASYRITLPNLNFTGGTLTSVAGNAGDTSGQYSLQGNVLNGAFTLTTNPAASTAVISAPIVSIASNATFNVAAGTVTGGSTPGVDLLISSSLRNYAGAGALVQPVTKTGAGVMKLSGVNTYTGATTVSNGTLALGVQNAIATTPSITLGDSVHSTSGKLATGGFSQAMTATLTIATNSHLDLGLGGQPGTGTVSFAASNGLWGTSALTVDDWTPGIDHLFFGNSNTALDPGQVSDITFTNFGAAKITATGEIVPVATVPTFVLGDVNGDGHFTVADVAAETTALANLTAYENNYGPSHLALNTDEVYAVLDQNHDGVINNVDIQAAISSLANTGGVGNGTLTAVPEPSSLLLLGLGGTLLLAGCVRRKFA